MSFSLMGGFSLGFVAGTVCVLELVVCKVDPLSTEVEVTTNSALAILALLPLLLSRLPPVFEVLLGYN